MITTVVDRFTRKGEPAGGKKKKKKPAPAKK